MKKLLLLAFCLLAFPAFGQTLASPGGGSSATFPTICPAPVASGQILYDNAGACGGITGWTTNGTTTITGAASTTLTIGGATIGPNALAVTGTALFNNQVTNALGTITTSQPFTITSTKNAAGVTFTDFLINSTDTASATASLLADFQVGASSKFAIIKTGSIYLGGASPSTALGGVGITMTNGGTLHVGAINGGVFLGRTEIFGADVLINNLGLKGKAANFIGWSADTTSFGTLDLALFRDAANTLAQRNGVNAQTVRVYGSFTDTSNGDWINITKAAGGAAVISTASNGTGVASTLGLTSSNVIITGKGTITAGTLGDQAQAFSLTATQPTTPTGSQSANTITVTSAGSAAQNNRALLITYAAGYTGSSATRALGADNNAAGTGTGLVPASGTNSPVNNAAHQGNTSVTTAGTNVGGLFLADGGNINAGLLGLAQVAKNSATNIGVVGAAINTGTSPVHVGGFFSLNQTTVPTVSAALIADNGAQTDAIFLARLAGVTKVAVEGSAGNLVVSTATDSTTTTSGALQVAGGAAIIKRVFIPGITASAGLQTAVLCQSSGGEMIADSVACLASSARFKNLAGSMEDGALTKLAALPMRRWNYKPEGIFHNDAEHVGPIAEDVAAMDPRLAGYDKDGKVRTYSTEQLLAYTIKALQELKADNDNLRQEMMRIAR